MAASTSSAVWGSEVDELSRSVDAGDGSFPYPWLDGAHAGELGRDRGIRSFLDEGDLRRALHHAQLFNQRADIALRLRF